MIKPNEEPTFEFDSYNQNYVANNGQPEDHVVANLSVINSSVEIMIQITRYIKKT